MLNRKWFTVIGVILLAVVVGGGYVLLTPKIINTIPADGASSVFSDTPIQITFSQDIQSDGVEKYLVLEPNTTGIYQVIGNTLVFTPSVPWAQDQRVTVSLLPGIKSTLGIPVLVGKTWQYDTRHPWLLFQMDTHDHSDVYSIDPNGLDVNKLVTNGDSVLDYTVSPDNQLYYSTVLSTGGSIIRRLDIQEQSLVDILPCQNAVCNQMRLSPDQSQLVYHRIERSESPGMKPALWMLDLTGGNASGEPNLVGIRNHVTRDPVWSAGGWLAFYDETSGAFQFYYPPTGQRVSFDNATGEPGSWSADGLTYAAPDINYPTNSSNTPLYYSQIILYQPQTSERTELTRDIRMEDLLPTFSPIDNDLVFARRYLNPQNWTPGRQIWAIQSNGTNPRPLTNSGVDNHLGFAWSPNGEMLAYLRFNTASLTGERQLWLMDMTRGTRQKILMNAYNLQWLP